MIKFEMLALKKIIEKCKRQKTISTHLVLQALNELEKEHEQLQKKHKELQHYSNKHQQIMKSEIKRLKATNKNLRENKRIVPEGPAPSKE